MMNALKTLVGFALGLFCMTVVGPLLVPPGFGEWLTRQFPILRNVSTWVIVPSCYACFALLLVLLFRTRRWFVFLLCLAALAGSTVASFIVLNDVFAFPSN